MKKIFETVIIAITSIIEIVTCMGLFIEAFNYEYNGWFHRNGLYLILLGIAIFLLPYIKFYIGELINGFKRNIILKRGTKQK